MIKIVKMPMFNQKVTATMARSVIHVVIGFDASDNGLTIEERNQHQRPDGEVQHG